jgi:hypothetical protein
VLIGDKKALAMGIKNRKQELRYTHLEFRLRETFSVSPAHSAERDEQSGQRLY